MPSATLVYSFPTPLGRRGTTALAVIALHVVLAIGLIVSMRLAPPIPVPDRRTQVVDVPLPKPPVEPARRASDGPADFRIEQAPFEPPPIDDQIQVRDEPVVIGGPVEVAPVQQPADVSGVRVLRGPQPPYPRAERILQHAGSVTLRVRVGVAGRAEQVEVATSSGHSRLDEAAVTAVRDWVFAPAQSATGPVARWVTLTVRFRLTD